MTHLVRPLLPDMHAVERHLRDSFSVRRLSNFGPAMARLAAALEDRLSSRNVVLTSSGHTAIMAAVATAGARRWAVPAYTFESTHLAASGNGREIVYVDVDDTGCISPDALRRTQFDGIVVVCPLSTIPDFAAIKEVVDDRPIVIDAAATFGTRIEVGLPVCVSLHATKTLPIGEGGLVYGIDDARAATIARYINFGLDASGTPSNEGTNAKLSEYAAAVGLALLEEVDVEIAARLRNAAAYHSRIAKMIPKSASADKTVYSMLPVFLPTGSAAVRARAALTRAEVAHRQYYKPLALLPGAKRCYDCNICLPVHGGLTPDEITMICDIIAEACDGL